MVPRAAPPHARPGGAPRARRCVYGIRHYGRHEREGPLDRADEPRRLPRGAEAARVQAAPEASEPRVPRLPAWREHGRRRTFLPQPRAHRGAAGGRAGRAVASARAGGTLGRPRACRRGRRGAPDRARRRRVLRRWVARQRDPPGGRVVQRHDERGFAAGRHLRGYVHGCSWRRALPRAPAFPRGRAVARPRPAGGRRARGGGAVRVVHGGRPPRGVALHGAVLVVQHDGRREPSARRVLHARRPHALPLRVHGLDAVERVRAVLHALPVRRVDERARRRALPREDGRRAQPVLRAVRVERVPRVCRRAAVHPQPALAAPRADGGVRMVPLLRREPREGQGVLARPPPARPREGVHRRPRGVHARRQRELHVPHAHRAEEGRRRGDA